MGESVKATGASCLRAARSGVDQRHLAEDVVVGQRFEHEISEPNFDLPVLNGEYFHGIVAVTEDDIAGLEFANRNARAPANIRKSIGASVIWLPSPSQLCGRSTAAQDR